VKFPKVKVKRDLANVKKYAENHELCQVCGGVANDVHHIVFKSRGGSDSDDNLIALCRICHQEAHGINSREVREELFRIKGTCGLRG